MQSQNLLSIRKLAKTGRVLCRILLILVLLAAVVLAGCAAVLFFLPETTLHITASGTAAVELESSFLDMGTSFVTSSGLTVNGVPFDIGTDSAGNLLLENAEFSISAANAALAILAMMPLPVVLLIVLLAASRLCRELAVCRAPFSPEVIRCVRRLGFSFLPFMLLGGLSETAVSLLLGQFHLHISIELSYILPCLAMLLLVEIFRYGALLQQESDETL